MDAATWDAIDLEVDRAIQRANRPFDIGPRNAVDIAAMRYAERHDEGLARMQRVKRAALAARGTKKARLMRRGRRIGARWVATLDRLILAVCVAAGDEVRR